MFNVKCSMCSKQADHLLSRSSYIGPPALCEYHFRLYLEYLNGSQKNKGKWDAFHKEVEQTKSISEEMTLQSMSAPLDTITS